MRPQRDEVRSGTIYGFAAYGIWGIFPFYFHWMAPAGAWEILAHRIAWTMLTCLVLLARARDVGFLGSLVRNPRLLGGVAIAAVLIAVNWVVYVAAVVAHEVTEAALGYFLNPLVTVALGVVVLRERLRPMQWAAVGIGLVAAVYLSVVGGRVPVIALTLAGSFALYGLMKNRLGASLTAVRSLVAETTTLFPVAVAIIVVLNLHGSGTFTSNPPGHGMLLALSGVVTAIPLLLFAAAARRVPLVTIGLLQFLTPLMQLLCGLVLGETMSSARWFGFGCVWVALVVLTVDSARHARRVRLAPLPA